MEKFGREKIVAALVAAMKGLICCSGRERKSGGQVIYPYLPEEIIIDILSHLPVKSLVRFKCVCKNWNSTTLDPRFIFLHMNQCSHLSFVPNTPCPSSTGTFIYKSSCAGGFLLEQTVDPFPLRYRIRNPEMHQVLELPNPIIPSLRIHINVFISSDDDRINLKVVSAHKDENRVIGYQVLNLGNESSNNYSWRPLEVPHELQINRLRVLWSFLHISKVCYCAWVTGNGQDPDPIQIDILDMEKENYVGTTTCPPAYNLLSRSSNVYLLSYNTNLALAHIVKDELRVLVLEDYTKNKWGERKFIIKLPVQIEVEQIALVQIWGSELSFKWGGRKLGTYDFNTRKVTTELSCSSNDDDIPILPSLLTLKGRSHFNVTKL